MTNEEAQRQYKGAVSKFEDKDYAEALSLLEALDLERPNSRHVTYHRILCLVELGRPEEARLFYRKIKGRVSTESLKRLDAAIQVSRTPEIAGDEAAAFQLSHSDEHLTTDMKIAPANATNIFVVQSSYPVTTSECSVVGHVKKGTFHVGDLATVMSPTGDPLTAPVARIGPSETPIKFVREGQFAVMLLRVDPCQVGAGASIYGKTREVATAPKKAPSPRIPRSHPMADSPAELTRIERMIAQGVYDEAERNLQAYIDAHRNSSTARKMLAQVYIDCPPPLGHPEKGLALIRDVYEACGDDDPSVTHILAKALAENGDPAAGLRFLERLYAACVDIEARSALEHRINSFRVRYGLGDVYELGDMYGEVLFESTDPEEVRLALENGVVPLDSQCRTNHVGSWWPLETKLGALYPDIAALYQQAPARWSPLLILLLIVLCLAIVAALFLPDILLVLNGLD